MSAELVQSAEIQALEVELQGLLNTPILIGHRGMNDIHSAREMEAAREYEARVEEMVLRVNEIAWLLEAKKSGLDPESYEYIGYADKYRLERTNISDFHLDDKRIPLYGLGWSKITKAETSVSVYRKKGVRSVPKDVYLRPDLLWIKKANEFFMNPARIEDPIIYLEDLKKIRVRLGEDPKPFDDALAQLRAIFDQ